MAKVYFRTDASELIGLGHVTRSLALADMLKERKYHEIYFVIQKPSQSVLEQIQEVTKDIIQLDLTDDFISEARLFAQKYLTGEEIVVLDGYSFGTEYQSIIKAKSKKLICIDDLHSYHFVADVVINHAGGVKPDDYSCEPYTKLYLGMEYALLRRPFLEASKQKREIKKIENAFICFGGSDPLNFTEQALRVCIESQLFKEIHVVMGSAYRHVEILRGLAEDNKTVFLYQNLKAVELCGLLNRCQMAIVSASGIALEVWASGIEATLVVMTAKNQKDLFRGLKDQPNYFIFIDRVPSSGEVKRILKQGFLDCWKTKNRQKIGLLVSELIGVFR